MTSPKTTRILKKENKDQISVVVCTKNEERRIENCLKSVILNNPSEIIIVDGGSGDQTVKIAQKYTKKIIQSNKSSLTRDRQLGIDAASNEYIAMIDSDHRLQKGDLKSLLNDLKKYNFDIVQAQLVSFDNNNYWNSAEEDSWYLTHNIPGPKKMIGVAPAIFKKSLFKKIRFNDHITRTIDDTDFMYRLSRIPGVKFGIGETQIRQLHCGSLKDYIKKFQWYGKGDGEFCIKHKNRTYSMIYHLLIRYPILYSLRAITKRRIKAIPFFILQGYIRFFGLVSRVI